jgi:hypothetical protein
MKSIPDQLGIVGQSEIGEWGNRSGLLHQQSAFLQSHLIGEWVLIGILDSHKLNRLLLPTLVLGRIKIDCLEQVSGYVRLLHRMVGRIVR